MCYMPISIAYTYVLGGMAIGIQDPYNSAIQEFVPTNRTLSPTGPLSVQ